MTGFSANLVFKDFSRFLIVFFLVMLNFPFPTFKLFTIVNSFSIVDIYLFFKL